MSYNQVAVRDGKGHKDRITMLPESIKKPLKEHLEKVWQLHQKDLSEGFGSVFMPYALARKYRNAEREWGWQYVFPSQNRSTDPRSGEIRRHHLSEQVLQRAIKAAIRQAKISKIGRIPYGIHLQPICSKTATIFAAFRNC